MSRAHGDHDVDSRPCVACISKEVPYSLGGQVLNYIYYPIYREQYCTSYQVKITELHKTEGRVTDYSLHPAIPLPVKYTQCKLRGEMGYLWKKEVNARRSR